MIFACFGCVVINHQKGGDCKENGLRAIWLNEFWCLMINTTWELMCLLVFVFVVHRMLKLTWIKTLKKATPQKKTLRRSSEVQEKIKCCLRTVRCLTPDCPVHQEQ
jgi:hypothetical protein